MNVGAAQASLLACVQDEKRHTMHLRPPAGPLPRRERQYDPSPVAASAFEADIARRIATTASRSNVVLELGTIQCPPASNFPSGEQKARFLSGDSLLQAIRT